ncbi:hypothetical protein TcCL_ESM10689, partial [Trypanosoma cruzi]
CSRTATPVGETVKAHRLRSNTRRAIDHNTATLSPFFILFYSRCLSVCPITNTSNECAPSQKNKKDARCRRPTAGQHSRPPTAIAAQGTALTSESQHHNVHHTIVQ